VLAYKPRKTGTICRMAGSSTDDELRVELGEVPYGRSRRVEWIRAHIERLDPLSLGGGRVAETYRVMGVLGEHLDRLNSDLGGMAAGGMVALHGTDELNDAYRAYHRARERLVAAFRTEAYIEEIETVLEHTARAGGIDTTRREAVLWHLDGCHRRGSHAVELATYLTARQLGTCHDHHAMHHSYVPPTFVRADLLVRTPEWIAQYARWCDPAGAGDCSNSYILTEPECDYVRGLWDGEKNHLERAVNAAKRLASAGGMRIAQ